jgi:hypothetical protein
MSTNQNNITVVPSIDAVPLSFKQKFKAGGVSKNVIRFEREEDMIVMCLSAFVHDYVHDYNLGSMHARVVKGNISRKNPDEPSLFENLGINVGNTIFKIISYPVGGHRDISMYNDEQFEDESTADPRKTKFYEYLNNNELSIPKLTGGETVEKPPTNTMEKMPSVDNFKQDSIEDSAAIVEESPVTVEESTGIVEETPAIVEETPAIVEETPAIVEEPNVAEGIVEEDIPVKTITFSDVKDSLLIPSVISSLNIEQIISIFEKNADFLNFHSGLNTYIVTYLGYDVNKNEELEETSTQKNETANNAIKASFNYIINDLKDMNKSMYFNFYGDMFSLLLESYEIISKKNIDNTKDPFYILNSSEILYQFIIFYVTYISVENYDSFNQLVSKMSGGDETPENDENEELQMEDAAGPSEDEVSGTIPDSSLSSSGLLPQQRKAVEEIPEYVFITHNNLLTTITRGMFIKLGIWKRIFFPDTPIADISPEDYVFGFEQLNEITYNKLVELFPINPVTEISTETASAAVQEGKIGNKNNELLILEILILKRLLVEMSPSKTLTFGAKIDDDLKNYMDSFYLYNYNIQEPHTEDIIMLDDEIIHNPIFEGENSKQLETEVEELYAMCEEGCKDDYENDFSAGSNYNDFIEGGGLCISKPGGPDCPIQSNANVDKKIEEEDFQAPDNFEDFINEEKNEGPVINEEPVIKEEQVIKEEPVINEEQVIKEEPVINEEPVENIVAPPVERRELNPDIDIIEPPRPPSIPILFNKLKKMYQNNMFTIKQLQDSKIEPIRKDGVDIDNLYDLLKLNQILMHKKGTRVNIPAPKYKFVINNAANVGSNINGSRMFIPRSFLETIKKIVDEIKQGVFDSETVDDQTIDKINEEKLQRYTKDTENELEEKYIFLETNFENEAKELNSKKRGKTITIREYNRLLEVKNEQKKFERTEIVPLENKLFLLEVLKENPDFYHDFETNFSLWFRDSQPIFGLYRSLQRGIFCPTSSMMDAMDNCSLKYNTTEPKEVGTSYSEIIYEKDGKKISFGGVVLNYNERVDGNEQLTAKIYYTLDCNVGANTSEDTMRINTLPIKVSESNDLKARVAYQGVVNMIKEIYYSSESKETLEGVDYIKEMWKRMQYQYDPDGFNQLLGVTALKTMGDYLQECQACFKWGGYVNNTDEFPEELKRNRQFKRIKDKLIYRSVSKEGSIIPYDENTGDGLRLGIQGDRPSGFRSIYMLLNGEGDVNDQGITGYMFTSSTQNPSRTLLVSRNSSNMREPNSNGLKGNVIYVTRELQVPDRDNLLRSLEFLNVKDKNRKVEGIDVTPEIRESTIIGSEDVLGKLLQNPMTKIHPLKNSEYEEWLDYNTKFVPVQPIVEVENEKTDDEEAREKKAQMKNKTDVEDARDERKKTFKQTKGLDPSKKQATKEAIKQEKLRIKAEQDAENARKKAEQDALNLEIRNAKIAINYLRDDLSAKQKAAKSIQKIPISFLNNPEKTAEIQGLQIPEHIYKFIYDESAENDRISRLAEEKVRLDNEEKARKKQETALENARIKAEQEAYESSPEGIAEREAREKEEQEENERLAREREAAASAAAAAAASAAEEKEKRKLQVQTEIASLEEEQNSIPKKVKDRTQEQKERIKEIESILKPLRKEWEKIRRGGGTLANRKPHKHYKTKRQHKNTNKLTKRYKKQKIPKRTRKNN